jgi:hypothetical protein
MSLMTQRKTAQFFMRMDPDVKVAGEKAAAQERRSLASLLEVLLIEYCRERGLLTKTGRLPRKERRP